MNHDSAERNNRKSQKSMKSGDSSKAEDRDQLMDLAEPETQLRKLRTYQSIAKSLTKRLKQKDQGRRGSTGRASGAQSGTDSEESHEYDANGDRIIAIDDMDSDSDGQEKRPAAEIAAYKKLPINNMSNLSLSRGGKKQTIDMFSSAENSLASASDLQASGINSRDLAASNAEGGTSSRKRGSISTPRYM